MSRAVRERLRAACIQVTSAARIADNIALCDPLIRQAAGDGAELVMLPEVVNLVQRDRTKARAEIRTEAEEPALAAFRRLAAELSVWIHVGSLAVRLEDDDRFANRGFLIDDAGRVRARYDKIHMFDVDLEGGERYRESAGYRPGDRAVLADTPWGGYGMAICYDVRFPALYRALALAGARIVTAPSCFTRKTGQAHWHALMRARAIETGCFMIAAAQCGRHEDGRETYGHSLIVAPWGEVLADGGEAPGVVMAELDLAKVDEARAMVPSLFNARDFQPPAPLDLAAAGE